MDAKLHKPEIGDMFTLGYEATLKVCTVTKIEGDVVYYDVFREEPGFFILGSLQHQLAEWL